MKEEISCLRPVERLPQLPPDLLASFFDAVPSQACILNRHGDIIAINAAWQDFAHANGGQADYWLGANYLTVTEVVLNDTDALAVSVGLRQVLAATIPSFQHEYACHSPTEQRFFRCIISPLTSNDGKPAGAAVMHLDITGQKAAEAHALTASRAKSDFLASLSHELRTPLNAVIGFSEMLMMELFGPLGDHRYVGYATDIHDAGKHLLSLINEVLDLSKVEAGKFQLKEETINLAELVRHTVPLIAERAERNKLHLNMELPESLPTLYADARLVRQMLLNLMSNAVKFTPQYGSVTVSAHLAEDGALWMKVADTGIGIHIQDLPRVLEPFGQVDSELARMHSDESTGLGLPLTVRFAKLHGAHLDIDSEPGKGTRIAVVFPPCLVGIRQ